MMRVPAGMGWVAAVPLLAVAPAVAQLSTATLTGVVTKDGTPVGNGTLVTARNRDTGIVVRATTRDDGSYVLPGLVPGTYEVSCPGCGGAVASVRVGDTAMQNLQAETNAKVELVGTVQRAAVKSSEVGTSVSRAQIDGLPQVTRNFLSFADLAPGVRFDVDPSGNVKVQSGSQNQDNINVFIDGVSQKNYILRGGLAGMDSTRGNPFPQSAVAEYKIISQNYKAEFDQVSSVAITAVTKSGTNVLHGDVFWDHTSGSWTAYSPFQQKARASGVDRPNTRQDQYGFTLGGPINKNVAHFFIAYEAKEIEEPRQVVAQRPDLLPNAGIVPELLAKQGATTANFKEHLVVAKVDAQLSDDSRIDVSARVRREDDLVPENKKISVPGNDLNRRNDETRFDIKHEWMSDDWLNEARIGYEDSVWNPRSNSSEPLVKYIVSPANDKDNAFEVLYAGGSPNAQYRGQKGTLFQNDLTYTGRAGHTIKGGAKVKLMEFNLSGTSRSVDVLRVLIDNVTGLPTTVQTDPALAPAAVRFKDKMFGLYLQDDWAVSPQLEVNLGLRWDYEDNALNNDYVTPADRVAALFAPDVPRFGLTPPAGQTYAESLAKGGVKIEDYISNGSSRKAFTGAWQPRVGFSYDVHGDRNTVVFGGLGRAYDRTMANHALDELQKNAQPHGEIWLIKNDHKMPYTDQFSMGLRQAIAHWNAEVGYTRSYSHNQFNWYGGNRDANGGWATQSPIDPLWGGPDGYGTLILGDFVSRAKTQTIYLKMDKPYSQVPGWGLVATYAYSDGKTTNRQWTNDIFNLTYGKPGQGGWHPSSDVEKHRLVVAGAMDVPWGILLSGKLTLGSGKPYQIIDCSAGFSQCVFRRGDGGSFEQVDLAISKTFALAGGRFVLRADVLNLFDSSNLGYYDGSVGGPGNPRNDRGGDNPNFGQPGDLLGPTRTVKVSIAYVF